MRHYEIVLIIHPDQQDQVEGILNRLAESIQAGEGKVHRMENWGRRQLAYPIARVHKAIYVLMNVELPQATFDELNETLKFNDAIIRKLIVAKSEAVTAMSKLYKETLATQEQERARERRREDELRRRQEEREAQARREAERNGEADGAEAEAAEPVESTAESEPTAAAEATPEASAATTEEE